MTVLPGRRPGDRRVRVGRVHAEVFSIPVRPRRRRPIPPPLAVILGFIVLIAIGTVLLVMPLASASGSWTSPLAALFTATSAACVTGLVVLDTGTYWSPFGHVVIYGLIQVGGFGIATASALLLVLAIGRRTGLHDRLLIAATAGAANVGSVVPLVRRVAAYTLAVQAGGAAILALDRLLHGTDPVGAAWWGIFHASSAYNNAGFDLTGGFGSLVPDAENVLVLATIAVLIVAGGLGYAIVADVAARRTWHRLALETKLVLAVTGLLLGGGWVAFLAAEWGNPATLGPLPPLARVANAGFLSVTARTAGFNTVDMSLLEPHALFLVIGLMFIGGASGSTAGGIKVNSLGVLLVAIRSVVRGEPSAAAFGRRLPHALVYRALAVGLLGALIVFAATMTLELTTDAPFLAVLFEAVSAFGTVGLTTGITPGLPEPAQIVLILTMFAGRLGPLTLVLALASRARRTPARPAVESLRIG